MAKQKPEIYQLSITLRASEPLIWRRLLVPSNLSLMNLHLVMQIAMGWEDAHTHRFLVGDTCYSIPIEDFFSKKVDCEDAQKVKLSDFVTGEGYHFSYEYDFGDEWMHDILIEQVSAPQNIPTLICLEGEGACPPEDIGGVTGFAGFVQAMNDPQHENHESYKSWYLDVYGVDQFDAQNFDIELVNDLLQSMVGDD